MDQPGTAHPRSPSPHGPPPETAPPACRTGTDAPVDDSPSPRTPPVPAGGGPASWHGIVEASLEGLDGPTIVSRAQDGDPQAFEWLVSAHQGGIFRLSYRMLNDRAGAEDVVQETFVSVWRSLPKLSAPQAFIPWLYRTATNKCLDTLRTRKRNPSDPMAEGDLEDATPPHGRDKLVAGSVRDPAQDFEIQAQMRALQDLLQTVPPGLRACWLLREVHGFSYEEIAAIVQLPLSTVRGRIARAKGLLAEGMAPWR